MGKSRSSTHIAGAKPIRTRVARPLFKQIPGGSPVNQTQRAHKRDGRKSAATAGLNDLDQDRAASVADEGGASAATVEAQEPTAPVSSPPPRAAGIKRRDRANLRY